MARAAAWRPRALGLAWICAIGAGVVPAAAAVSAAPAVDAPRPGWTVLHCGVARGVLYLTYAEDGQAAITPAVDNRAVREACAKAGYPVAGAVRARAARPPISVEPGGNGTRRLLAPLPSQPQPHFTASAVGSSLSIDGRNDGDVPQSCLVSFSWTWDGNPGAPRSTSTQVTLPGRQRNRAVSLSAPGFGARFVAPPQTACRPLE